MSEANEHNPTPPQAYKAWREQIAKGETQGVIQMYQDAYLEAIRRSRTHHPMYLDACCTLCAEKPVRYAKTKGGFHKLCDNCRAMCADLLVPELTVKQQDAIQDAVFDNDYRKMEALKQAGEWIKSAE